ncbi:MAG TPA: 50S ribosomal protein L28 [Candidatus Moranbacteria bacterium]|nr:50S ribosomal protein L28 [Candidatus Moranbacteria bacterium]
MSKVCAICGRGASTGHQVSHSNVKTLRKFSINLQTKKINGVRKKVCTKCVKTMSK